MRERSRHVNLSELQEVPDWRQLIEEVRVSKQPAIIRADAEDIVELRPTSSGPAAARLPKGKATSPTDPIWKLDGIGRSGRRDISGNHDHYLAQWERSQA